MIGDDGEREAYGSLVEMFPQLAATSEPIPLAPVHVRALAFEDGPVFTLGFVVWKDPGGARALRRELGARIEAALLALLSRPASLIADEGERRPSRVVVFFFDAVEGEIDAALAPFGLRKVDFDPASFATAMSHVRGEAHRCGAPEPDVPSAVYSVPVAVPDGDRGVVLERLETMLRDSLHDRVWGDAPGSHFRALSNTLVAIGEAPLATTTESIDRIEALAGQLVPHRIRYLPPLLFQALCDAVGVVASKELRRPIDWAPAEPDEDGFAPPPLLRAKLPEGFVHIPIGEHVLRWSMMPLAEGEIPPPLSEWLVDQFGER